jgi:hypothetical protein
MVARPTKNSIIKARNETDSVAVVIYHRRGEIQKRLRRRRRFSINGCWHAYEKQVVVSF